MAKILEGDLVLESIKTAPVSIIEADQNFKLLHSQIELLIADLPKFVKDAVVTMVVNYNEEEGFFYTKSPFPAPVVNQALKQITVTNVPEKYFECHILIPNVRPSVLAIKWYSCADIATPFTLETRAVGISALAQEFNDGAWKYQAPIGTGEFILVHSPTHITEHFVLLVTKTPTLDYISLTNTELVISKADFSSSGVTLSDGTNAEILLYEDMESLATQHCALPAGVNLGSHIGSFWVDDFQTYGYLTACPNTGVYSTYLPDDRMRRYPGYNFKSSVDGAYWSPSQFDQSINVIPASSPIVSVPTTLSFLITFWAFRLQVAQLGVEFQLYLIRGGLAGFRVYNHTDGLIIGGVIVPIANQEEVQIAVKGFDGATIEVYKNGVLLGSGTMDLATGVTNAGQVQISMYALSGQQIGYIGVGSIRFFVECATVTAQDILDLYNHDLFAKLSYSYADTGVRTLYKNGAPSIEHMGISYDYRNTPVTVSGDTFGIQYDNLIDETFIARDNNIKVIFPEQTAPFQDIIEISSDAGYYEVPVEETKLSANYNTFINPQEIISFNFDSIAVPLPTTGLLRYYPLTANTNDTVSAQHGTLTGTSAFLDGIGLEMPDNDGMLYPPITLPLGFTISCWIKMRVGEYQLEIITRDPAYGTQYPILRAYGDQIRCYDGTQVNNPVYAAISGTWQDGYRNVIFKWDGNTQTAYFRVDGVLLTPIYTTTPPAQWLRAGGIGDYTIGGGAVSEYLYYNRVVSVNEELAIYQNGIDFHS